MQQKWKWPVCTGFKEEQSGCKILKTIFFLFLHLYPYMRPWWLKIMALCLGVWKMRITKYSHKLLVFMWRHKILKSKFTGPAKFYGHHVEENYPKNISYQKIFSCMITFVFWNMACLSFKISTVHDIAMAPWQSCRPWKNGLFLDLCKNWERCLCVYALARKKRA